MRRRDNAPTEQQHREALLRPPDKTFSQKCKDFIWDKQNKTCLTRTPMNWLSITGYYIIFLLCVCLLFYISLLTSSIISSNEGRPAYILGESPIGPTPTLNYFPLSGTKPLIWLSDKISYKHYVNNIKKTFEGYKKANSSFNSEAFGECSKPPFGYDKKSPCLFFRLSRLIAWKPYPYKAGDTLPKIVPKDVKSKISNSSSPKIWLSCRGATPKDRDHITSEFFKFQGSQGFDPSRFPFDGQATFVDPIVAVKFTDPNPRKTVYAFMCSAWAKRLNSSTSGVEVTYYFE